MNHGRSGRRTRHGKRSASKFDAKKDRTADGQAPENTLALPFQPSGAEFSGGSIGRDTPGDLNGGIGPDGAGRCRAERGPATPTALPCPPNGQLNQTNNWKCRQSTAKILQIEIDGAVRKYGENHVGMLTLGCPDEVHEMDEFQRRYNSLMTHFLRERFVQTAVVIQRYKHGIHAHLAVVTDWDMRGRLDFKALKRRDYRSAPPKLRAEWKLFRGVLPGYGFGRHELLPMYGDSSGLGRYLARYLVRELGTRRRGDKRHKLVRYSQSWQRCVVGQFTWCDRRAKRAIERAEELAKRLWGTWGRMVWDIGANWRYKLMRTLYCGDEYNLIVMTAEDDLKYYSGPLFALGEAWKAADLRKADAEHEEAWLRAIGV